MKIALVTYNTLFCSDNRILESFHALYKESSKATNAIIALQEIRNKTAKHHVAQRVERFFPKYQAATLISPRPSLHDLGLMTLSSIPIIDSIPILLPRLPNRPNLPSVFLKTTPQHGALMTRYKLGTKILRVINVHLNVYGGIKHKHKQMQVIQDYLSLTPADYEIICGDFNTIGPIRIQKKSVLKQKQAIYRHLGKDFKEVDIPTWTSDTESSLSPLLPAGKFIYKAFKKTGITFRQKLDWVFVRNLTCTSARVRHDLKGSDHYPVIVTLSTQ